MSEIKEQIERANEMIADLVRMYDAKLIEAREIGKMIDEVTETKIKFMNLLKEVSE